MKNNNYIFKWQDIGDIKLGRPNLGLKTDVSTHRVFNYSIRSILISNFGVEKSNYIFYEAGRLAGKEFFKNLIEKDINFYNLISKLEKLFIELGIGILRVEETDMENLSFIITIAEDLDCSGLSNTNETVCNYDEGFLAGIFEEYTGFDFYVKEIECWANGGKICRFEVKKKVKNSLL